MNIVLSNGLKKTNILKNTFIKCLSMEEGWFHPDFDKYEEENQYYDEWMGKTYNLPFSFRLSNNDDEI